MNNFFVQRPIVAMVIAIVTVIVGIVSFIGLPIEQYPNITPPVVEVRGSYTGADAITAINTMPGMVIDAEAGRPVLSNRAGGVSGPALKPIALRCVAEIAAAVSVPVIGTGGVGTGRDAAEMLIAGATAVGVGSAVWYRGPEVLGEIASELANWLDDHGFAGVDDIRGLALR